MNRLDLEDLTSWSNWEHDKRMPRLYADLASCGLTQNQSRIYLCLLLTGPAPARSISRALGLHRVDVYRRLHELEELGLLETYVDSPKKYIALNPTEAASVLVRRHEEKLAKLRQRSHDVFKRLAAIQNSLSQRSQSLPGQFHDSTYRFVVGRKRYYDEVKDLVRNAKREVLRISSAGGLIRTFLSGLQNDYAIAKSRGVEIMMISEIDDRNRNYARKLSHIVKLRRLDNLRLRFTVIDRSISIISARFDVDADTLESPQDRYIILDNAELSEALYQVFEHMWAASKPIPRR